MPDVSDACASEDTELEKWTFLRYCVLGLVFLSQVMKLRWCAIAEEQAREEREAKRAAQEPVEPGGFFWASAVEEPVPEEPGGFFWSSVVEEPVPEEPGGFFSWLSAVEETPGQEGAVSDEPLLSRSPYKYLEHPFKEHPELTAKITSTCWFESILRAGWMFVLTEGVGLTIYFSMSAVMDNLAIFFIKGPHGASVCATVKDVSLYTMAIVTFLPNVLLGSWLQRTLYNSEGGNTLCKKALFVVIMALITVASFSLRTWLVYAKGYVSEVDWLLHADNVPAEWRVVMAVAIPPVIDGIQSTALIMVGSHAKPLLAQLTVTEEVETIILFGNPGSGKSTLGNAITGKPGHFKAGQDSAAVTRCMQTCTGQRRVVVDGPGFNDPHEDQRVSAAGECKKMLEYGVDKKCKIIFVCCCHPAGRTVPEDRSTMRIILEASGLESDNSYGIIMNMCPPDWLKKIQSGRTKHAAMALLQDGFPCKTALMHFLPLINGDAAEQDLTGSEELSKFLREVPNVELKSRNIKDINARSYDAIQKELEQNKMEQQEMQALIRKMEDRERAMQADATTAAQQEARTIYFLMLPFAMVLIMLPFVLASLGLPGFSAKLPPIRLPFGFFASFEYGTVPLYLSMMLYKLKSAASSWTKGKMPEQDWRIFGHRCHVGVFRIGTLQNWHVWVLVQLYDAITDAKSWQTLMSSHAEPWIIYYWGFTLIASIAVPLCYTIFDMNFDFTLVCEGMFEDVGQALMSIVQLADAQRELPPAILFSALFAVLGVINLTGVLWNRLRRAAAAHVPLGQPLLP